MSLVTGSPINVTISENTLPAAVLAEISATDGDSDSLVYTLSRADSSNAEEYFYVDQIGNNATLRVRQLLTSDRPTAVYRMRITVSDGVNTVRIPTRGKTIPSISSRSHCTSRLPVLISSLFLVNVLRDQFPPIFSQNYTTVVLENVTVGHVLSVPKFRAVDPDLRGELVYRVIGDGMAPVFFGLNEANKPRVVQPLTLAPRDQYKVC